MSYIGQPPVLSNFPVDAFVATGGQTAFTLSRNAAGNNSVIVAINGAIQQPGTSYSVAGTALTLTEGAVTGDAVWVWHLGVQGIIQEAASLSSNLVATPAEQETGTDVTKVVTSGRQKLHPSAAKAWCVFNGSLTGTNAPTAGYNVTSVTRNSAGNYTINLTTPFSSADYAGVAMGSGLGLPSPTVEFSAKTASTFTIVTSGTNSGSYEAKDSALVFCVFYGDQ